MALPTVAWDETSPANTDDRYLGAGKITELKTQVRELIAVDHQMDYVYGSSQQDTDWGRHNTLTLVAQSSNPAPVADTCILFTKIISGIAETFFIDEDENAMQLTSNGSWIAGMTGEVRIWKGTVANKPPGWELYGHNGCFARGIDTSTTTPGTTGGESSKILVRANTPSHAHAIAGDGSHTHSVDARAGELDAISYPHVFTTYKLTTKTAPFVSSGWHSHYSDIKGSSEAFDNQPAYYAVVFIKKS